MKNQTSNRLTVDDVIVNPRLIELLQQAKLKVTKVNDNPTNDELKNVRFEVIDGDLAGKRYMVKCERADKVKVDDTIKVKITASRPYANVTKNRNDPSKTFTWLNPSFTGFIVSIIK